MKPDTTPISEVTTSESFALRAFCAAHSSQAEQYKVNCAVECRRVK
jgi:hypothetical protein